MTTFRAFHKIAAALLPFSAILVFSATSSAEALSPWWHFSSLSRPTYLAPGQQDDQVVITAVNRGDAAADSRVQPITLTAKLPAGLEPVAIEAYVDEHVTADVSNPIECSLASLSCTLTDHEIDEEPPSHPILELIPPYNQIQMRILVDVKGDAKSGEISEAKIAGGGAAPVSVKQAITVSDSPVPFGVRTYEMSAEEPGGGPDAQAGSHPFQFTTTVGFNEDFEAGELNGLPLGTGGVFTKPAALTKDLHFNTPPGLIGNPVPFAQCRLAVFLQAPRECPQQSVVGVARVYATIPDVQAAFVVPFAEPLINLEPARGEPARFGFNVNGELPVILDTAVRAGGDYGVTVNVTNITQAAGYLGSEVTFWGVPGDPRHNLQRGKNCLTKALLEANGQSTEIECAPLREADPPPFLAMPTSCTGPLNTTLGFDSWKEPLNVLSIENTAAMPALDGCNRLQFEPSVKVTPDGSAGSTPTGLNVDVHVNQESVLSGSGLAESDVRNITVALPEGVAINPSSGDGLEACSEDLAGFKGFAEIPTEPGVNNATFTPYLPGSVNALAAGETAAFEPGIDFCANASKIGEATIHTPVLPNPLKGFVYLAEQEANPFGSLMAMYIIAEDPVSGSVVKLPGVVHLTSTGQIIATFENQPQLPFEDAELHFFGGERAPLASPIHCGSYTTNATLTPWSGNEAAGMSSIFDITSGPATTAHPDGTPCPGQTLPFDPTSTGGATNIQAGAFSPATTTFSRAPGEQNVQSVEVKLPPGLLGALPGVELCREPQAALGTCGENSKIGETIVSVGVGGDPFTVKGGKVFITGPYNGTRECTMGEPGCAPFGLSAATPAKAGPFDLADTRNNHPACDCILVRAKVEVNPITGALTVVSDPPGSSDSIPTMIEGIPLQIQHVNITTTRTDFQFNPTNCSKFKVEANLLAAEGGTDHLEVPFQVTNCAILKFEPKFSVSTSAKTSRLNGASFHAELTYPSLPFGTQTNISQVKVSLPKALPSRLKTLQKACTAAQFHADPAGCPPASMVGYAKAMTPLVPVPLEGPAYFVSNGSEAFPNLIVVLQGYGVTIDLVGDTFISKTGVTSSTFKTVPDAPVNSFELTLPEGKYSALTADGNLCMQKKLVMPTEFIAQNGAEFHQNTKIAVTGCPKAKKTTHRHKKAKKTKSSHRRRRQGQRK